MNTTIVMLLSAGLVLLADQASKGLLTSLLRERGSWPARGRLKLKPVATKGVLAPSGRSRLLLLGVLGLAVLSTAILIQDGRFIQAAAGQIGLAAAIGGATSNLLDRFRLAAVIDWIDLGFWPAFNLADVAIVLGLAATLLSFG